MDFDNTSIRILQINLGRSIAASSLLSKNIDNYDLILVQEPHCKKNIPSCLPTSCPVLRGSDDISWAITLIANTDLSLMHHTNFSSKYLITTELMIDKERFIVINVYLPGDYDDNVFIDELQRKVHAFCDTCIIIAGDFNAHSPAWGGDAFDLRGGMLEEFFAVNDLIIINNPLSSPTFISSRGESWIDIAVCSANYHSKIQDWRILDEDSLTEHAYITFNLVNINRSSTSPYLPRNKYACNRANWPAIKNFLDDHLIDQYSEDPAIVRGQIDKNIETIINACELYIPKRIVQYIRKVCLGGPSS
ncbi:uncharacterized protein LOC111630147 [Centruroides sculpturatus]|uniref:uncharacterized protein LOC111630147 n=1 Tax=Centruroides sculpturatus TaxID=218467 RepID=UPI000C6D52D3|nr:uncharacterized protein LOC111630147 [Centruroides sculpturatus]